MAKLEEENNEKACPCGKGTVTWTFFSPTTFYQRGMEGPSSLNCDACSQEWKLRRGGELLHKGDQARAQEALKAVHAAESALQRDVLKPVVDALYARAIAQGRTGAAWYEALLTLIPASLGPSVEEFKKHRGRHSLDVWLAGVVNLDNAASLATSLGLSVPVAERVQAQSDARQAYSVARSAVRHF